MVNPEDHIGLVCSIVLRHLGPQDHGTPVEDTDQYQNGMLGLLYACRRFDPGRGNRFSTYATACIRGFILGGFKIPADKRGKLTYHLSQMPPGLWLRDPGRMDEEHTRRERRCYALSLIRSLPNARDRRILGRRYFRGLTLDETAKLEHPALSRERVRQIEKKAMRLLRLFQSAE
jgi:RNA polymerase sigma factor (sigma-70 family)